MQQGSRAYLAAGEMLRCVRTGEPAAETVLGMPFFEYLASDAEASDVFNRAMASGAAARASLVLEYDWSGASVVADIGDLKAQVLRVLLGRGSTGPNVLRVRRPSRRERLFRQITGT